MMDTSLKRALQLALLVTCFSLCAQAQGPGTPCPSTISAQNFTGTISTTTADAFIPCTTSSAGTIAGVSICFGTLTASNAPITIGVYNYTTVPHTLLCSVNTTVSASPGLGACTSGGGQPTYIAISGCGNVTSGQTIFGAWIQGASTIQFNYCTSSCGSPPTVYSDNTATYPTLNTTFDATASGALTLYGYINITPLSTTGTAILPPMMGR